MNNALSLWFYTIHSKNAELIHLLESNEVLPPDNYEQCLIESIKCHHHNIVDYIKNAFLYQNEKNVQQNEEIISNYIKYHNYSQFQNDGIIDHGFFYINYYHYDKLFKLILKKKEKSIEEKSIQYPNIQSAINNNDIELIYYYLSQMSEIPEGLFKLTKIKQIVIPSSVTTIAEKAFEYCSLTQITIPSSVTSIGCNVFDRYSSLKQISIPSSVTSIRNSAFGDCS